MKFYALTLGALACVLATTACRASPPPTRAEAPPQAAPAATPVIPPRDQTDAVKAAEKRVRAYLATEAAGRAVTTQVHDGPAGTKIVRGVIEGAYPGSGVRAALVGADATVFGPRSPSGLADWARAQGWLVKAPAPADLLRVVSVLLFDDLLATQPEQQPSVVRDGGALRLDVKRTVFPSQSVEAVRVTIGAAGPATLSIGGEPVSVSISAAEELEAALAMDDAAGMARGVQALTGTTDPRGRTALAQVSARGNESLAASALMAIGSSPEAAAALKSAWSKLEKPARDALKAMATELYGAPFAARLD
jgi:hypothetical protein